MFEFLHWSAALFAVLGLGLWFWSAHSVARLKRPMRRIAICAAIASALIQAATPTPPTLSSNVELWAFAATVSPIV